MHSYQKPKKNHWQGRIDQPFHPLSQRWHQEIKLWDLTKPYPLPAQTFAFAFLGFATDVGVKRNQGRPGAAFGPKALRLGLSSLPKINAPLLDCGDIVVQKEDLESAQKALGQAVAHILSQKAFPVLLGGGHEIAYGHYLGLRQHFKKQALSIVNLDAHLDLRSFEKGAHSGSGFLQMAQDEKKLRLPFDYLCLGVQKSANTALLFETAQKLKTRFIEASDLCPFETQTHKKLKVQLHSKNPTYLTLCLDVLAEAFAPGVSAPTPFGLTPVTVKKILSEIILNQKVVSFDVAELCPKLDLSGSTTRLAAQLIDHTLRQILDAKKPS